LVILHILLTIIAFFIIILLGRSNVWGLTFYSYVENTCMTTSFHYEERFAPIKLSQPHHFFLLKCLYQARKVSGHAFVSGVAILPLSMRFILDCGTVWTVWYLYALNKGNNKITELRIILQRKVKTHKYINRHNQSKTGILWKP
jgi:hypothetical protein